MKVYISGCISADPSRTLEEKKKAFYDAARQITNMGHEAVNPLELPAACTDGSCLLQNKHPERSHEESEHSWACYMRGDLKALLECDAIHQLVNWHLSPGAVGEYDTAVLLGMYIYAL